LEFFCHHSVFRGFSYNNTKCFYSNLKYFHLQKQKIIFSLDCPAKKKELKKFLISGIASILQTTVFHKLLLCCHASLFSFVFRVYNSPFNKKICLMICFTLNFYIQILKSWFFKFLVFGLPVLHLHNCAKSLFAYVCVRVCVCVCVCLHSIR